MGFDGEKVKVLARTDRSRKGEVDEQIKGLVSFLNSCKDYFTTSSCSGRISLLAPGEKKHDTIWLLKSHKAVEKDAVKEALASLPKEEVWFRMQGFILHVTCRDLDAARLLLRCAQESGLKRSGLVLPFSAVRVLIQGLDKLNTPIAKGGTLLANENYLGPLLDAANAQLKKNLERLARFESVCKDKI